MRMTSEAGCVVRRALRRISVPEPAQVGEVARQPIRPRFRPYVSRDRRGARPVGRPDWPGRGRAAESVVVASAWGRATTRIDGRAGVSAASGTVRRRRGPIQPPRDAGTAGESQHAQHEQTNQWCSSHGVSSRLDLVRLPSMEPESLRIRVPAEFHRHGERARPANSSVSPKPELARFLRSKRTFHLPHPAQCEQ